MSVWRFMGLMGTSIVAMAAEPATFRLPMPMQFVPEVRAASWSRQTTSAPSTLVAHPADAPNERWEFTDRVALSLDPGMPLEPVLAGLSLTLDRTVRPGLYVLQASDASAAWQAAAELVGREGVRAAHPVVHPPWVPLDAYAPAPDDGFFRAQVAGVPGQWYLENRDPETGVELGADINIRPAWAVTRGEGVTVGVADSGVQLDHPDLVDRTAGAPHFNFASGQPQGGPVLQGSRGAHATACAGLIAATANNSLGLSGVAPEARIASWVIWTNTPKGPTTITDERLGDVFRHAGETVAVQNHSWGPADHFQRGPSLLEDAGIEDAWQHGRGGLGVVMVRGAGNGRMGLDQAGDDGFANDPRAVCVAAVRKDGRAASYSEPGACVLVAAPGGEYGEGGLFTTDLTGADGANAIGFLPPFEYLSDYSFRWGEVLPGFIGTSAAAPLVSGVAALVLSVNPRLTARDVQQILLLSARHYFTADPGLVRNRAGLLFSHNTGYGIVDAAEAVHWAALWSNRPPALEVSAEAKGSAVIPDAGFRVEMETDGPAGTPLIFSGLRATELHPEVATEWLPLVDLGQALQDPSARLDGRGALIERGGGPVAEKLARAAAFGAAFAVVYNAAADAITEGCPGGEQLCLLGGTDYSPLPAIFVRRSGGLALQDGLRADSGRRARIHLNGAVRQFTVSEDLQCEQVGVRLRTDHTGRGDLRVTLRSPSGTVSVLQRYNADTSAGPTDWTYWSMQHFFEPSAGTWELRVTDQAELEGTGSVLGATLLVRGVPIGDGDRDGLEDGWELTRLGTLDQGPADDTDDDGASNLRESLAGTDPARDEVSRSPDVAFFNEERVRVSWPGRPGNGYDLSAAATLGSWESVTRIPRRFPVTSAVVPAPAEGGGFFRVTPDPVVEPQSP